MNNKKTLEAIKEVDETNLKNKISENFSHEGIKELFNFISLQEKRYKQFKKEENYTYFKQYVEIDENGVYCLIQNIDINNNKDRDFINSGFQSLDIFFKILFKDNSSIHTRGSGDWGGMDIEELTDFKQIIKYIMRGTT